MQVSIGRDKVEHIKEAFELTHSLTGPKHYRHASRIVVYGKSISLRTPSSSGKTQE